MDQAVKTWNERSTVEQLANIGAEIGRAINWKKKNKKYARMAFFRALDLLQQTKSDPKNRSKLSELCRLYELLVDWWLGNPVYQSDDQSWERYFYAYNWAARL
jgi:hypothetical protein